MSSSQQTLATETAELQSAYAEDKAAVQAFVQSQDRKITDLEAQLATMQQAQPAQDLSGIQSVIAAMRADVVGLQTSNTTSGSSATGSSASVADGGTSVSGGASVS